MVGDLYVHTNTETQTRHIWLYQNCKEWQRIDIQRKTHHPSLQDRVLKMRRDGTPSWITGASYVTMKGRKEKVTRGPLGQRGGCDIVVWMMLLGIIIRYIFYVYR